MRWKLGVAFLLLGCCTALGCTPIDSVKREAGGETEETGTRTSTDEVSQPDAATSSTSDDPMTTDVGTIVTQATPCETEDERACEGHGVREISVCKGGMWTPDNPCKMNERCDSTVGMCAPIAAVCTGQEPGSLFCDGDKRLVCDDLVSARELLCGENQQCSRKDGRVSCTCAPGAEPSAQGDRCDVVSGCGQDGSGCDSLTRCVLGAGNQTTCTPCPSSYVGDGRKGCVPQLDALSISCGPGSTPQMLALTSGVYEYRLGVPMLCQRVTLTATGPDQTELEIDGTAVQPGAAWSSAFLRIGENAIKIVIAAQSGRSSSYQLKLERAGSKSDYLKASNSRRDASFGFGVAAEGHTIIAGAPFESSNGSSADDSSVRDAGAAYVFELEGDKWVQKQLIKSDAPREADFFGMSVAIAGDLMVVGAPRYNMMLFKVVSPTVPGAAHVYRRSGSSWTHEQELRPSEGSGADMFGFHVAVHGETVLVGAPYDSQGGSHAGAVYSFVRNNGTWTQEQKVLSSAPIAESSLGVSMAIQGDLFVAGAMQDSSAAEAAGSAYVFARSAGVWTEQQRLVAPSPKALATFGTVVVIHNDRILVTAPGLDLRQRTTPPGEGFLFARDLSTNKWTLAQPFRAAAPRSKDLFGGSAALTSNALIISANGDGSSSRGLDGDPSRNDAALSGAAYVFGLQGTEYVQTSYLKAFNADEGDNFGHSVAATDTFLVVAAPFESSSARGVSGQDQANGLDNSASSSGAVYVYR
jgi:hypothetical protein